MARSKVRIIVDTNWWLSFVINKFDSQLTSILLNPKIEIYASEELTVEIFKALDAPKLAKFLLQENVQAFKLEFEQIVKTVEVTEKVAVCRDEKDNFLLALAKKANADFLVTGDKDLLILSKFENTVILTMTDFLQILK
jgi:hypothetical protein